MKKYFYILFLFFAANQSATADTCSAANRDNLKLLQKISEDAGNLRMQIANDSMPSNEYCPLINRIYEPGFLLVQMVPQALASACEDIDHDQWKRVEEKTKENGEKFETQLNSLAAMCASPNALIDKPQLLDLFDQMIEFITLPRQKITEFQEKYCNSNAQGALHE